MEEQGLQIYTQFLSQEVIDTFCEQLRQQGCKPDTAAAYRRNLRTLFQFLPENKALNKTNIDRYLLWLQETHNMSRTVNVHIAGLNSFLQYCGRRELCVAHMVIDKNEAQPELTREEYLRLLQAAKHREDEKLYFLVKVFATIGLSVQDLPNLTVQAVREGHLKGTKGEASLHIPNCLQQELLGYISRNAIRTGPLFLDGSRQPICRSTVTVAMKKLCQDARVEEEKVNPRCLKRLYNTTREAIFSELIFLAEQDYERLLEAEQPTYGWD